MDFAMEAMACFVAGEFGPHSIQFAVTGRGPLSASKTSTEFTSIGTTLTTNV